MSGWSRGLAIVLGLFVIGVGFAAIFEPAIVAGFVTALFAISFIMMGFFALSMGIAGQRVRMPQTMTQGGTTSRQPTTTIPGQATEPK
jgi:hypothetical protein